MRVPPDEFSRIASTVEFADGLVLIFVVGPDFRAEEGLALIRSRLPTSRPTLWHRVDRDGPDLVSAVQGAGLSEPVLLVHGLEYLDAEARATTEASLNMLRDRLVALKAAIIFWVPRDGLESFQRHCADLLAWRSLLASLSEEQVPVAPLVEVRRVYLTRLRLELRVRLKLQLGFSPAHPEVLCGRSVLPEGSPAAVPLHQWVRETHRGMLIGEAATGKTTALMALALQYAEEGIQGDGDAPCPQLVSAAGVMADLLLGIEVGLPRMTVSEAYLAPAHAELAREGQLLLLLDDVDVLGLDERAPVIDWLRELGLMYPRLRITAAGQSSFEILGPQWKQARLEALSLNQWREALGREVDDRRLAVIKAVLQGLEALQPSTEEVPPLLIQRVLTQAVSFTDEDSIYIRQFDRLVRQLATRLGLQWKGPMDFEFLVSGLAFHALVQGTQSFDEQDVLEALKGSIQEMNADEPQIQSYIRFLFELITNEGTGFISRTASGRVGFPHVLLQAFLAAGWLARQGPEQAALLLGPHLDTPRWNSVVLLTAVRLVARGQDALRFITLIHRAPVHDRAAEPGRMALVLAAARAAQLQTWEIVAWWSEAEALSRREATSQAEQSAHQALRHALKCLQAPGVAHAP